MYIKKKKRIIAKVGLVPTRIWEGNLNTQAIILLPVLKTNRIIQI